MTSGVFSHPARVPNARCYGWTDEWQEVRCYFEGDVDGERDAEARMVYWDCPECGTPYAEPEEYR